MTLGTGLVWSTILILVGSSIYQISIRKKWRLIGKIFAAVTLVIGIVAAGIWGYVYWQQQPYIVTELNSVELGMTPVEVTLTKGRPAIVLDENKYQHVWGFKRYEFSDIDTVVIFRGNDPTTMSASAICARHDNYSKLLGIGNYHTENDIIAKFGEPTHISINDKGTSKYISYKQWNVAYEITQNRVSEQCISSTGKMTYRHEYDG